MNYNIGDIVQSVAGRDKGQKFIIWDKVEASVFLVNGKSKKIANPKKKNCQHLVFMEKSEELLKNIDADKKINDAYIRKILKN